MISYTVKTWDNTLCETKYIEGDVTLEHYVWKGLDCQPILSETTVQYDDITITNMDALLSDDQSTLTIVGNWDVAEGFLETTYNISYQVITADCDQLKGLFSINWHNVMKFFVLRNLLFS